MITFETLAQSELECPKNLSYNSSLEYKDLIGFKSSLSSSKKYYSLAFNIWNVILQLLRILSYLLFLSKFYEDL